jgi:Mrp family chromosome partitioning ATPase
VIPFSTRARIISVASGKGGAGKTNVAVNLAVAFAQAGDRTLLLSRLQGRSGHYMKPAMLDSQLDSLEPPAGALRLDISQPPEALVAAIKAGLAET